VKYVVGALLIVGTLVVTYIAIPKQVVDECCEYIGLLGPEEVSEVPGVDHAQIEAARDDGSIPASVPGLKLHDVLKAFELPDLHGKQVTVDPAQSKLTAVTWVSSLCPTSMVYEIRLNELKRDYPSVNWVAINSSAMESVAELREHFERNDADALNWNVLKDEGNVIADRFGARVSTETFVFDQQGRLQYRGAIDDARNPQRVEVKYLRTVLDALLAGDEPKWRYQPAKGCCPIDRVKRDAPKAPETH
jgi:hypothetical protein